MKVVLALSLVANAILGYLLMSRENPSVQPTRERVIIETHADFERPQQKGEKAKTPEVAKPSPEVKEKTSEKKSESLDESFDESPVLDTAPMRDDEFRMVVERMEESRQNFFMDRLNLPPEFITRYQDLRRQHEERMSQMWNGNVEPSFEDQEKMLKLQKQYHEDLQKLFGKENWERYQKFRERYNRRSMRRQREDNRPFIIMQP